MEERFHSIPEASKITGIDERRIRRWCRLGTIKHAKPGKRQYIVAVNNAQLVYLNMKGVGDGL
jgi:predicted site-specific integrase-resolvase